MHDVTQGSKSRQPILWVGLACSVLMAGVLSAQEQPISEPGADAWSRLSADLDTNQDGTISREEFDQGTSHFPRLDSNGDGVLTEDEIANAPGLGHKGMGRGPVGAGLVRGADTDRDGTITIGEWESFLLTADPDGDGIVDPADLRPNHSGSGRRGPGRRGPGLRGGPGRGQPGFDGAGDEGEDSADRQALREQRMLEMQQRMLESVDRNQDGNLDIDDLNTIFAELDQNADGELAGDELPPRRRGPRHHGPRHHVGQGGGPGQQG